MCQAYHRQYGSRFISVMPTNLYGPGDNFDLLDSHVIPALMRRFHQSRVTGPRGGGLGQRRSPAGVSLRGGPGRCCLFLMEHYEESEIINVGVGRDLTIRELAEKVARVTGFQGR